MEIVRSVCETPDNNTQVYIPPTGSGFWRVISAGDRLTFLSEKGKDYLVQGKTYYVRKSITTMIATLTTERVKNFAVAFKELS